LLELCCLEPSSLNRPHPPHLWAHRDFTARQLIRDVFAVRERLATHEWFRAFAAHCFLSCRPLRPRGVRTSYRPNSRCRHGLRHGNTGSTLPISPQSVSRGRSFRGCTGSQLLRPDRLLASPDGSDRNTLPATGGFYVQAFDGAVTLTVAGYNYDIELDSYVGGTSTRCNGS
jgi:hypothetical protein